MQKTLWRETLELWVFTLVKIPLIGWLRPRVLELTETRSVIMMRLKHRTKNHLRSMYFGVLCTGADLAPGLLTINMLKKHKTKCTFLFKDFQADFLKRAEADTHFICDEGHIIAETVKKAVETKERQNTTINVVATTPSISGDEPVAKFKLTISVKARG